jgi:hypothetical protein
VNAVTASALAAGLLMSFCGIAGGENFPDPNGGASVGVFIPAFSAPEGSALGVNAATIVNLTVWKTLRKAPYPNPDHRYFGDGFVVWSESTLAQTTDMGLSWVDEQGRQHTLREAQLILAGAAIPYGNGAVVTMHLLIRPAEQENAQTWVIPPSAYASEKAALPKRDLDGLTIDIFPDREFEFQSVALSGDDLKLFSSPALLEVHKDGPHGEVIGRVGGYMHGIRQEGNYAEVETRSGIRGFLVTPPARPEVLYVADFVGGIIRLLRSDWSGAYALFTRQTDGTAPTAVTVDALLLAAYCREQDNEDASSLIERASALSPAAPRVLQYRAMVNYSGIVRRLKMGDVSSASKLVPKYRESVAMLGRAVGSENTWVHRAQVIASQLGELNVKASQ